MNELQQIILIQLLFYIGMLALSYYKLKRKQRLGHIYGVTIGDLFEYWDSIYYVPIIGILIAWIVCLLVCIVNFFMWVSTTKFYKGIQYILNKEI